MTTRAIELLRGAPHSPSACMLSQWRGFGDGVAAGIAEATGQAPDPPKDYGPCLCKCRMCHLGLCTGFGPPMWPWERGWAIADARWRKLARLAQQRVFREWEELPEGRTADSYRFRVDDVYSDYGDPDGPIGIEDTYLTDHTSERDRLVGNILAGYNEARVTERGTCATCDDTVTWHRQPEEP